MVSEDILLDSVTAGLLLYSKDGTLIRVNDAFLDIIGYSREEISSVTYWDLIPEEDMENSKQNHDRLYKDKKIGPLEKKFLHKNGHYVDVKITKIVLQDSDGTDYIWSTLEDITESKNAQRVLNKAQEMGQIGHWHLDLISNELSWSDETYRIFGLEPQEFAATYEAFVERIYPEDRDRVNNAYTHSLEVDEAYEIEHRVIRPDGTVRYVVERCEHNHDSQGNISGSIGTVFDVTDAKKRTLELYKAKEAAESANVAKSSFIASISHELRTPMNAILGFTKKILSDSSLSEKNINDLKIINKSGEHLLSLINEVLDLSKIEAGAMEIESNPLDLHTLFQQVSQLLKVKSDEKGLSLELDIKSTVPNYVMGDESKMRQLILNIAGNAIKFTEKGRVKITVDAKDHETKDTFSVIEITIEDTGIGISKEMQSRVFEAFTQDEGGKKVEGGTGLGLAITKKIVEMMGGTISLESDGDSGTKFIITLELKKSEVAAPSRYQTTQNIIGIEPTERKRMLVVDDVLTNRMLVKLMFEDIGFEIKEAESGEEALEIFKEWPADFIWMDIKMKGLDGYETAQLIRQEPGGKVVKIAAFTAGLLNDESERFDTSSCDYFVPKPYSKQQLFDVVKEALDVTYIYEEEQNITERVDFDVDMIKTVSAEEVDAIIKAAEKSSGIKVKKSLETIKEKSPQLYAHLKGFASKYDFEAILKLLKDRDV
jgi:PAS domain S-box-containing protein